MDYSSKTPIRLLLLILIVPTLLWGYGKAIVRFAQITNNANERGDKSDERDLGRGNDLSSNSRRNTRQRGGSSLVDAQQPQKNDGNKAALKVINASVGITKDSLATNENGAPVSQSLSVSHSPVGAQDDQVKDSVAEAKLISTPVKTEEFAPDAAKSPGTTTISPKTVESSKSVEIPMSSNGSSGNNIEPVGESKTYTNRVLKPVIPVSSQTTNQRNLKIESGNKSPRVSFVGVLGIPTILFAGLFVVMWGIISGRIQRIMF